MEKITIKKFKKEYQDRCKEIILKGLEEHWGWLNKNLNTDLNDIASSYKQDIFLTAWIDDTLIATGAAKIQENGIAQIVRMSVLKQHRSKGIGQQLLNSLTCEVSKIGIKKIILETTTEWEKVVQFYLKNGFKKTNIKGKDTFFEKII